MRFLRTVHTRGTMTLPNDIRNALSISEGDILEFEVVRVVRRSGAAASPLASPSPSQSVGQPAPGEQ